jgi:transposase-like protein
MTCPNCKGELSKVWQPKSAATSMAIAHVQFSCSTCGETFSREQLRPRKPSVKAVALQPEAF